MIYFDKLDKFLKKDISYKILFKRETVCLCLNLSFDKKVKNSHFDAIIRINLYNVHKFTVISVIYSSHGQVQPNKFPKFL